MPGNGPVGSVDFQGLTTWRRLPASRVFTERSMNTRDFRSIESWKVLLLLPHPQPLSHGELRDACRRCDALGFDHEPPPPQQDPQRLAEPCRTRPRRSHNDASRHGAAQRNHRLAREQAEDGQLSDLGRRVDPAEVTPAQQPGAPDRVPRRRADQHYVAAGAAEIEKRLQGLSIGWRGCPTKRLRILVAEWGALASRELHHPLHDRKLPSAHRAPQDPRPHHPTHHLPGVPTGVSRSEEHTSELQSQSNLVCRLLLEKKK